MSSIILKLKLLGQDDIEVPCESFGFSEYESFLIVFGDEGNEMPIGFFSTQNLLGFSVSYNYTREMEKPIVWN